MAHPASKWTEEEAMVWWRRRRRQAWHPPRRFRVYADLITPAPGAVTGPGVPEAAPAKPTATKGGPDDDA
jgi:hypothetical protein